MFLQILPFSFHTRAVPIIVVTALLTLQKSEMSDFLVVTDIGLLVMLFICSLAYSYQGHEHTGNCGDRGGNVQISLVPV